MGITAVFLNIKDQFIQSTQNYRGLTSLAFAQLGQGRTRDPPYLHSVYSKTIIEFRFRMMWKLPAKVGDSLRDLHNIMLSLIQY